MRDLSGIHLNTIAIDLDGTLVDSLPDLANAANHVLSRRGLDALDLEVVRRMVGDGIDTLLLRCLQQALGRAPGGGELQADIPVMRDFYARHVFEQSRLFAGVTEALALWRARGIRLACVTNKASTLTMPLLRRAGLENCFEVIYCADDPAERKPAPAMLLRLLADLNVAPAQCAMIGDSIHDIEAARAAGFLAIGVDYGYGNPASNHDSPPDFMLSRLDQLPIIAGHQEVSPPC